MMLYTIGSLGLPHNAMHSTSYVHNIMNSWYSHSFHKRKHINAFATLAVRQSVSITTGLVDTVDTVCLLPILDVYIYNIF